MRVLLLTLPIFFATACGFPFGGCGPANTNVAPRAVGAGEACGDDTNQICEGELVCTYDGSVGAQICEVPGSDFGHGDVADLSTPPDLSKLPDLAADLGDAGPNADAADLGQRD